MALTIGGAKIQNLNWESLLSSGLAFRLMVYFLSQGQQNIIQKNYPNIQKTVRHNRPEDIWKAMKIYFFA